jgi:hypothetical protein
MNSVPQRRAVIEECIALCEDERVEECGEEDHAYNMAIEHVVDALRAAISLPDAAAVGSTGNAEVSNETPRPREPTWTMVKAGQDALAEHGVMSIAWIAMWDAYQKAPE